MPAATATVVEVDAKVEQIMEDDERREARDSYRAAGGSKRRPLKSFMTKAEKRKAREEHAERIHEAIAELREPLGFERWIEALEFNPQLTPLNAALVAMQTPGLIVATAAQWNRQGYKVRKGEAAAGRITGKGFWPCAYFTAEQANAGDLEDFDAELPEPGIIEALRVEFVARLERGEKARDVLPAIAELRADPPAPVEPAAAGEFVQSLDAEPEPEDRPTPQERLEAVACWRERLAREREECDRALTELAAEREIPVATIAKRIGISRQAIYQLVAA